MALQAIIQDVAAQLTGLYGQSVATQDAAGNLFFGHRWRHQRDTAPPKVIWAPTSESYGPWDVSSYFPGKITRAQMAQRAIATRSCTIEVDVWAVPDNAAVEQLLNCVLWATWNTARGSMEFVSGRWLEEGEDEDLKLGAAYRATLLFRVPVVDPSAADASSVVLTGLPQTNQVNQTTG